MTNQKTPEHDELADAAPRSSKPPKRLDLCSQEGAEAQAKELNAWWHARGHPEVQHWVEKIPFTAIPGMKKHVPHDGTTKHGVFGVRSNLVNGLPPKGDSQ
jgi:hypothetical protein